MESLSLSGTGKETADAVKGLLESWDIGTDTVGACFDTTASNTGQYTGACVLLENLLEPPLLWLACRHHIFEVLLSDVFTTCMGPSSGPDILLFKHFRSTWPKLQHQPQDTSPLVVAPTDVLQFLRTTMDDKHPREDYLELIHLAAIMVGLPVVSSIRRPGALNRARWMAKASYALKIELAERGIQLIQQFNRSSKDEVQKQWLLQVVEQHRKHFSTTPTMSELNFI